ncbi:sugar ABC transporter substrate-binding protein [Variovorax sp. OV329]|uniref:ABC transporter substrate-binding protein n=1 Tax=Variovorax sp. OV329 TaxID=1882825 RepID=UPI0008F3582C|nr:sugar ABC transporter substrate-binding protein [Variovorax sp. OV329]SFN52289.1 carbohydrate ABC transporter substrate-binding protein, CUT1 family [Variovorax sp. OV329]
MHEQSGNRRDFILYAGAAAAGLASTIALPPARAAQKKISFLTWNISDQQELFKQWIAEFKKIRPDVEVEWLDKNGTEYAAYYQTQVMAGTPPDIIDTQGALWLEYAAAGGLMDLTPYLEKDADVRARFNAAYLANWKLENKNYMLPFLLTKTMVMFNRTMFKASDIAEPPASFEQMMSSSAKMASGDKSGLLLLNFDWLYWPMFKMNGVDLLTADMKKAAFNTPQAVAVLEALTQQTAGGGINKISWTGRWTEPIGAFASGNVGMLMAHSPAFFVIRGQAPWLNANTFGVANAPGGWSTPNSHGWGISKGSRHPEEAWEFLKMATSERWTQRLSESRKVVTGNIASDKAILEAMRSQDPLAAQVLQTQLENTDKLTGNWPLPNDARVKQAFYPEIQNAVLGRKSAAQALKDAESKVNRVLAA